MTMRFDIPDPVFTVSAEVDYSNRERRDWDNDVYIARLEIGRVTVMERRYDYNSPIYVEDEKDAKDAILQEFGEKMKELLA
jgi:hypothetical protein